MARAEELQDLDLSLRSHNNPSLDYNTSTFGHLVKNSWSWREDMDVGKIRRHESHNNLRNTHTAPSVSVIEVVIKYVDMMLGWSPNPIQKLPVVR